MCNAWWHFEMMCKRFELRFERAREAKKKQFILCLLESWDIFKSATNPSCSLHPHRWCSEAANVSRNVSFELFHLKADSLLIPIKNFSFLSVLLFSFYLSLTTKSQIRRGKRIAQFYGNSTRKLICLFVFSSGLRWHKSLYPNFFISFLSRYYIRLNPLSYPSSNCAWARVRNATEIRIREEKKL